MGGSETEEPHLVALRREFLPIWVCIKHALETSRKVPTESNPAPWWTSGRGGKSLCWISCQKGKMVAKY